jgi:hypothetical protein
MATIDIDEVKQVFADLKNSINLFYSNNAEIFTNGTLSMDDVLRNTSKMEYFLDRRFEELWLMEREDRRRLQSRIEFGMHYGYNRKRALSTESVNPFPDPPSERRDSCASMPDLLPIPQTTSIPEVCSSEAVENTVVRNILNPEDEDLQEVDATEEFNHSHIPHENETAFIRESSVILPSTQWRWNSNSLLGSLLFNPPILR